MTTRQAKNDPKSAYKASRKPEMTVVGTGIFFAVDGKGAPGGEAFQAAIGSLFAAAYTAKFTGKYSGGTDFKVGGLECLYFTCPTVPKDQWEWRMLVRVGDTTSAKELKAAVKSVKERKGLDISHVKRLRWKEGRVAQVLHVGPYDQVAPVYEQLIAFAAEQGLTLVPPAHEIYLNDPRRAKPEKLKTIVRMGVKKG